LCISILLRIPKNVITATIKKVGNANHACVFLDISISIYYSSIVFLINTAKAIVKAKTTSPRNE